MLIEMFGVPTSGKSTLIREIRKFGMVTSGFIDNESIPDKWNCFAKHITETYDNPTIFNTDKGLGKIKNNTLRALAAAYRGTTYDYPIVFDELVAQYGMSLAIRLECEWDWYFNEMPLPGLLVYLTAHRTVLLKRTQNRGKVIKIQKMERCMDCAPIIIDILRRRNCQILELDTGTHNPTACAQKTIRRIHILCV